MIGYACLRALYEAYMKQIRDRNARDEYVYDEGVTAGETMGLAIGKAEGKAEGKLRENKGIC